MRIESIDINTCKNVIAIFSYFQNEFLRSQPKESKKRMHLKTILRNDITISYVRCKCWTNNLCSWSTRPGFWKFII